MVVTRRLQDAMEVINKQYEVARGDKGPQLVSESVSVKFLDINEEKRSKKSDYHLLTEPSDADELQVHVDADMHYTTYTLEELQAMHEQEKRAYAQAHSNFSAMVMGANKNSYLQRGGIFDVMNNKTGGIVSSGTTVSFKLPDKTPLISRQAILTSAESSMFILSDDRTCPGAAATKIYIGSLEREQVLRTLDFEKDDTTVSQAQISTLTKDGQLSNTPYLLGLNRNRLAKWDLRTKEGVVQWTGGKDFAQRTNFTCMASSGDGHVVVGSADGKVRLYNANTLTQAKNTIHRLGEPITAVDISFDSRWIVATTDDYLLVIRADYEDDGGHRQNAFVSRGAQGRLAMRLLRLKPADEMAEGLAGYPFKSAKFTWVTDSNEYERWIAASRGEYTIMWNLRRVKTSNAVASANGGVPVFEEYHLSERRQKTVVDSAFMQHRYAPAVAADALVVATMDKVYTLV